MKNILVIGATSAIAQEVIKCFASNGARLCLVARNVERLSAVKNDAEVRGAQLVETFQLDATDLDRHLDVIRFSYEKLGALDAVLIAHGTLSNQKSCEQSVEETLKEWKVNCLSILSFVTLIANDFEKQKKGCIAVISSVAGDRGRQSNYVYGASKAALTSFLQGLRNRLFKSGVSVVTIKPGTVDTPMTASLKKGLLFAKPKSVGKDIYKAMLAGKDVVYTPGYWRLIMFIIRSIPETIFKKLSL